MKGKMLSQNHPITQAINEMYKPIEPVVWIVNFENGTSLSSKHFPTGFLAISQQDREKIRALRFKLGSNTYNISRKTTDSNGKAIIAKGIFYHIKEGRSTLFGKYQTQIPFFAERFGFCYNSWGDAEVIRIDHSVYLQQVHKRIVQIEKELEKNSWEKAGARIDQITSAPITYDVKIDKFKENIAGTLPGRMLKHDDGKDTGFSVSAIGMEVIRSLTNKNEPYNAKILEEIIQNHKIPCCRVNLDLFGDLADLEKLGTPPRITENSKEITYKNE